MKDNDSVMNENNNQINDSDYEMDEAKNNILEKQPRHFDGNLVGKQFISYFYNSWVTDPTVLIEEGIIKSYSLILFKSKKYKGNEFIELLKTIKSNKLEFANCQVEILDSRSRQVYILVTGLITRNTQKNFFSQSFLIVYMGEKQTNKWTLMNSILNIF
jgi:hypothetical protein